MARCWPPDPEHTAGGRDAAGLSTLVHRARQRALGHSTPTVTLNTYVGLWPDQIDRTRTLVDAALGHVRGAPAHGESVVVSCARSVPGGRSFRIEAAQSARGPPDHL